VASESLYEGIISIVVQDNDAPAQVAAVVDRLEAEMRKISTLPGVDLGEKITGSLGQGITSAEAGILKMGQMVQGLSAEFERLHRISGESFGRSPIAGQLLQAKYAAEELILTMARLSEVQGRQLRPDGYTHIPLTPEQRSNRLSPEEQARAAARANPVAGRASTDTGRLDPNPDEREAARREAIQKAASERIARDRVAAEAKAVDAEMEMERAASAERVRLRREEAARLAREDPDKVSSYGQLTPSERKSLSPRADGEGSNPSAEELVGGLLDQIDDRISLAGPRDNRNLYAAADINVQGAQAAMQALQRKLEEEAGSLDPEELEGLSRSLMAAYRRLLSATEARAGVLDRQAAEAIRFSVDTSGIDGRDSARLQKLQLDEATARATHDRLSSADPGQFSDAEVAAARIKLQHATEGVATQREREWTAAEKAADAEELSARTVQPKFAINPNASARVQQLQANKAMADAQYQTQMALTSPRLTSTTDRAQAYVKANTAAEQLTQQIQREKDAAQKAADEAEVKAKTVQPDFSGVDESAKAKVQQLQVNHAIADAQLKTLQALSPGLRTEAEIQQARLRVLKAEEELAKAGAEAAGAAGGNGRRPPGNFWTGLTQGYRGGGNGATGGLGGGFGQGLGEEAGFALKYYAFYQVFAAGSAIMAGIATATKDYTLAVNDLSIALGTNYTEAGKVADQYANIGSTLATAPTVAVNAGAKFARTFRNEDGSPDPYAGMVGARVGSAANVLEKSPEDADKVSESLIAVSKAFDLSATGASQLYDRATQIAQYYGFNSGAEMLSGTAQIADIGKASGYTPEDLFALVAGSMQGTGLTGDAVAGDLKRVLGADQSGINAVAANYGIDPTETFAKKVEDLSKVIDRLPKEEADRLMASLGGSRSGATFATALSGDAEAKKAIETSRSYLTADDRAEQKLKSLGGAMVQLGSDAQGLFTALAGSGMGDLLGVGVEFLHETLRALTTVIRLFNQAPVALRDTAAAIGALLAVSKVAAGVRGIEVGATGLGGLLPAAAGGTAARGAVARQLALAAGTGETAALSGAAAGIGGVGAAATAVLGPLALLAAAIGAIIIIGRAGQGADKDKAAADTAVGSVEAGKKAVAAEDVAKIRAEAKQQEDQAETFRVTSPTLIAAADALGRLRPEAWGGRETNAIAHSRDDAIQKLLDNAAALKARADDLEAQNAKDVGLSGTLEGRRFFGPDYSGVDTGASLIKQQGVGAHQSTTLLRDLIDNTPAQKDRLNKLLQPEEGTQGVADIIKGITDRIAKMTDPIAQQTELQRLAAAERDLLQKARQAKDGGQIDKASSLTGEVIKAADDSLISLTQARIDAIKATQPNYGKSRKAIESQLTSALRTVGNNQDINGMVQLMGLADQKFLDNFAAVIKAQQAVLKHAIAAFEAALAIAEENTNIAIANADDPRREAILSGTGSDAEKDLHSRIDKKKGQLDANQRILDSLKKAGPLAAPSGSAFKEGSAASTADDLAIAKLQAETIAGDPVSAATTQLKVAQYQLAHTGGDKVKYYQALRAVNDAEYALAQANADQAQAIALSAARPGDPVSQAAATLNAARIALAAAVPGTAAYYQALKGVNDDEYALAQSHNDVAVARVQAGAVSGDPLSSARTAVTAARMQVNAAVKGTAAYYQALKALHDSQYELGRAELEHANNLDLLGIDMTDPVAQAREKVRAAVRQRNYDRKHGVDTAADDVAVRQATSEAQRASFDQEFSDQQTNYNLNRISLSAYMSYLQSQHDYLTAVKHKTRDQVEELNQVDQALKSLTDSMDGQFNLGNIKVPTPYEVRRSMAGPPAGATTQTVTININGSDLNAVRGVMGEYLGQGVMQTTGTSTRKV
jgi:hypothetical protein